MTNIDAALNGGAFIRLAVSTASQDIVNNTSTLSWTATLFKGSFASFTFTPIQWFVTIDGTGYAGTFTFDFSGGATSKLVASGSTVVPHNADGTKTAAAGFSIADTGTSTGGPAAANGSHTPATIPRASTPTFELVSAPGVLVTQADAGVAIKILTNRADASFTHKIEYSLAAASGVIAASGVGASYASWTIPLSLLSQIPNADSSPNLAIKVTTYASGGVTVIGTKTVNFTMKAGVGIVPDLGTITRSEATTSPNVASLIGAYVQGVSKLNVAITSPVGIYGSQIVAQKIEVVGQAGNQVTSTTALGATVTPLSGVLPAVFTASGTVTLRATVTDSRNRTYSEDVTVTVLAYTLPTVVGVTARRSLSGGTVDESGTYIRVDIDDAAVQSLLVSAVQKNAITYRISTSPHGANTWTVKATTSPGGLTFDSNAVVGTYSVAASFDVKVEIYDKLAAPLIFTLSIATSEVPLHLGISGVGIGKFNEGLADLEVEGTIMQGGQFVLDASDVASTSAAGIVELGTPAEAKAGASALVVPTVQGARAAAVGRKNRIHNAMFRINQRAAASGTSMGSSDFFLDRWRSTTTTNAVTWTGGDYGRVLTIPTADAIRQTIERSDVPVGDYVLSWTGTATGRVYKAGGSVPSYAASPVTFTSDGLDDIRVEFTQGTLSFPQLELGVIPGEFEVLPYAEDLALCQRFYYRVAPALNGARLSVGGFQRSTTTGEVAVPLPVPLRTAPTITFNSLYWTDGVAFNGAVSAVTQHTGANNIPGMVYLDLTYASNGAIYRGGAISANGTSARLEFSAEF